MVSRIVPESLPPPIERTLDHQGEAGAQWILAAHLAKILEAGFVHDVRAERLRIAYLKGVFGRNRVVTLRLEGEAADAGVVHAIAIILVAHGQSIGLPRAGNRGEGRCCNVCADSELRR